ncbi:hypothetical protein BH23CHL8_BH23CHL8_27840 [soil metagenome]
MRRRGGIGVSLAVALVGLVGVPLAGPGAPGPVSAVQDAGVGAASWTPSTSITLMRPAEHLVAGDAYVFETTAVWSRAQRDGLARYVEAGLRYTHEVNDRSGRLSATGFWATNHPDPAFDRDDDDGDGRWEEAEITAGAQLPRPGREYVAVVEFSRWRSKQNRRCTWAWDRRKGSVEVFSQLSRDLLGEWQAMRYTLTYDRLAYPRVGTRPDLPEGSLGPECGPRAPLDTSHRDVVVTFVQPLAWSDFVALEDAGGRWSAFEAIGSAERDDLTWTCGGPVLETPGTQACATLGVQPAGVVAGGGAFPEDALEQLRGSPVVASVEPRQDAVTGLLGEVGGFGVEPPDLTLNDAYWRLFLDG